MRDMLVSNAFVTVVRSSQGRNIHAARGQLKGSRCTLACTYRPSASKETALLNKKEGTFHPLLSSTDSLIFYLYRFVPVIPTFAEQGG
jgi:hypothetical protein